MNIVAVIPARYGSTRYPGKPLLRETGKFLIQHVCERVRLARNIPRCLVATDDERILEAVRSFGGEAVMTRADHPSGTDRIAEVARNLGGAPNDILLNVQGDEPEIEPEYLDRLVGRMVADEAASAGTLACPFPPHGDPRDPNCVKVAINHAGHALYFSRAPIPYPRDSWSAGSTPATSAAPASPDTGKMPAPPVGFLLHLGVYAYRRAFLLEFAGWPPSPLERIEKLEQLRVLENGRAMLVEVVEKAAVGIDTPRDYEQFVARWRKKKEK